MLLGGGEDSPPTLASEQVRRALPFLRDWGSVLFFENAPVLRDFVFVSLDKIATLMSDLISFDTSKPGTSKLVNGILEHSALPSVWRVDMGFDDKTREALLVLLHECEVALPLPGGRSSLVPAMLDARPPDGKETWLNAPASGWRRAKMQVVLAPLLPADLLPRLVVRLQNLYARGCWSNGALLERKGQDDESASRAVVQQNRRERQLDIECAGIYPEDLRGQLFHVLEKLLLEGYHGLGLEARVGCPQCDEWACPLSSITKCLEKSRASMTCISCVEDIPIEGLSACVISQERAEKAFTLRLGKAGGTAQERESLRREFMRLVHMLVRGREGHSAAWRYGKPDVPCLWVPVARDTARGGWVLQPVCECLGCWHTIEGMSAHTESVAHSYFAMVAHAVEKLAQGGGRFEAGARAECVAHREGLPPARQEEELASSGALLRRFFDSVAACRKRGRGEGGSAASGAACRSGLSAVSALESPTLWMCEEHASKAAKPAVGGAAGLLEIISAQLYRWEWKDKDSGSYEPYESHDSYKIEEAFQRYKSGGDKSCVVHVHVGSGRKRERAATIDFGTMTVSLDGRWSTRVRRWDAHVRPPESWDHQDGNVAVVPITQSSDPLDYVLVESAFFKPRDDGKKPLISRDTHQIVQVRRIQNRGLLRDWLSQRSKIADLRGAGNVNELHAWHGSGTKNPIEIAEAPNGFLMQFGKAGGFYNQGTYCAEHASYSHHENYVYRSSDMEGQHGTTSGEFFHLILCRVILGNSWRLEKVLPDDLRGPGSFATLHERLKAEQYDSVTGGPHQPTLSGKGPNDSIMYVDYTGQQVLPEFIVTYKEGASA